MQTHAKTTGTRCCLGIWLRSFSTQVRPIVPLLRYHYEKKLSLGFILCDLFPKVHHHLYLRGSEACLVGSEACLAGFWALEGGNGWTDERTNGKISPFYRTLSPIGAAAPLQPNYDQKEVDNPKTRRPRNLMTPNLNILQDFAPYWGRCPATAQLQLKHSIGRQHVFIGHPI